MLSAILAIVGNIVPMILVNSGVIGPSTATLIASLLGPVQGLLGSIKAGDSGSQDALAVLAAASGVIGVLKGTALPADVLTQINGVDKDIQAALVAYAHAGEGFDPTLYKPISEV